MDNSDLLQNRTRVSIATDKGPVRGMIRGFGFYLEADGSTEIRYFVFLEPKYRDWLSNGMFVSTIVAHPDSLTVL